MVQWCILQLFYRMQPLIELSWYKLTLLIYFEITERVRKSFCNYINAFRLNFSTLYSMWILMLILVFAHVTQDLVPKNVLPDDFIRAIKYSDYSSVSTLYNLIYH